MKLKHYFLPGLMAAIATTGCDRISNDNNTVTTDDTATEQQLDQAIADRDTLISLITDINDGVLRIKQLENIITVNTSETPNARAQLINDINAIKETIAQRQERLKELEERLSKSNSYTQELKKNIAALRSQIESQQADIAKLTQQLGVAHETIASQATVIDTLTSTVQDVSRQLTVSQETNIALENAANTVYYAVGSEKNLKDHGIMEKKFLRSEKIMKDNFDQSYFTTADKRTLKTIPLYAKKAEVKTNQPASSYKFVTDPAGQLELVITNPTEFWRLTDYLVIQTK